MTCRACDGDGCPQCCQDCDYDTHTCPGCGIHLPHGEPCCRECDPNPPPEDENDELTDAIARAWMFGE